MNTQVTIRPFVSDDLPVARELLAANDLPPLDPASIAFAFTAVCDNVPVGFAAVETYGADALLRSVVVREDQRGSGIGETLTRSCIAEALRVGLESVYLLTSSADSFFQRVGFVGIERAAVAPGIAGSAEFASQCPQSARVYRLTLSTDDRIGDERLRHVVRESYARTAAEASRGSCGCGCAPTTTFAEEYAGIDGHVTEADLGLGCGIPTREAALKQGEIVLDLGSGAGNDVFVAARAVGEGGKVIGLDFTPEMVARARRNAETVGARNVEFIEGDIEAMPIASESVDAIVSNCVLNLVPNKQRAFREMLRVLRPGGRFAVSDIVRVADLPEHVAADPAAYAACVAGASHRDEYLAGLRAAGFVDVAVHAERQVQAELASPGGAASLLSLTVSGRKPVRESTPVDGASLRGG